MVKPKREDLNQFLIAHLNTIYDTLQVFLFSPISFFVDELESSLGQGFLQLFDRPAPPTQEKVSWNDVLQMSDHLSKQATIGYYHFDAETLFRCFVFSIFLLVILCLFVNSNNSGNAMD